MENLATKAKEDRALEIQLSGKGLGLDAYIHSVLGSSPGAARKKKYSKKAGLPGSDREMPKDMRAESTGS